MHNRSNGKWHTALTTSGIKRISRWAAVAATITVALTACAPAQTANNNGSSTAAPASNAGTTVRLAYFPNFTHAVGLVGVARGAFQQALGESNKLDVKAFNAGPALIEALLAGEVDIGYVGPNPAINGYVKSKGEALRIIAGASSGGALFVVRPEANIKTAKDLDGKQFATPQLGGTQDVALRYYLQQNGLKTADKGGTVKIIPTQNPDIVTLFKQGQIDGAWVPEPWATRLIQEANGQVFVDERTLWPNGKFVTTLVVVRTAFLNEHPNLVKKFLQAHVETVEFILANGEQAMQLTNKEIERLTTKPLPDKVIKQAFGNVELTYDPLPKTLLSVADAAYALGFLGQTKPDLSGIFDFKLLNEVLEQKSLPIVEAPAGK
jgi:NitT/TauT family transport system substrate-binding protein